MPFQALAARIAALEGAEAAVVTSSGMAAISSTLLALLRPGDHLLIQVSWAEPSTAPSVERMP